MMNYKQGWRPSIRRNKKNINRVNNNKKIYRFSLSFYI